MRENQKSAKNDFPSRGKIRKQLKTAFPHGGKSKISENRLSLTGENQKSVKNDFPSQGEIGKTPKVRQNFRSYVHFDTPLLFIL